MVRVERRRFLWLAAAAPLVLAARAEAALKIPTKVPPPRVRPLGVWRLLDRVPTVEVGTEPVDADILLTFRSEIDVAEPYLNVWPREVPLAPLPPPVPPDPDRPRITTPIPVGSPHRPAEEPLGEELVGGVVTPVRIPVRIDPSACTRPFRVTVQMSDGPTDVPDGAPTRRRATFSFVLRVVGRPCYTSTVPEPQLPTTGRRVNARPTSPPRPTKTPAIDRTSPVYLTRLAQFRTPTP